MKRRNIMVLMISLSLVLLLGSSYAMLRSTAEGKNPYVINVGTLQVSFEGSTDKLSLENMYPMSDTEGSSQSEELVFVVKNTGNIEARYNVYLEEISTDPEFKNYIRFISNKNDQEYNEPKTMGYDKYIDLEARLDATKSASYKVKVWLDKEAEDEYMDKTFTAKVVIEGNQIDTSNTLYTKINNAIKEHPNTTIVEDDVTYLSGSNTDVNYNYVWYSGKLWRITSINKDGTIKMVTEKPQTILSWGSTTNFETSFVYEWLNEDFLDTLYNYENIIVTDYLWNNTLSKNYNEKIPKTNMVKASVGLLTVYEYYQSYIIKSFSNRYLSNIFNQLLLTPCSSDNVWTMTLRGEVIKSSNSLTDSFGISPVIVIKSEIAISSGDGSSTIPYQIKGDKEVGKEKEKINERVSGEYVKFDNQLYRVLEVENNKTIKLVTSSYLKDGNETITKMFSNTDNTYNSSVNSSSDEYWGYYLNNDWYNKINEKYKKMLVDNTYYLGTYTVLDGYKTTICDTKNMPLKKCDKVNSIWVGKVGLLRVGEKFASQTNDEYLATRDFVLISPINSNILGIREGWINRFTISEKLPTKITITLSDEAVIASGKGIEEDPYEISCPSCNNT